MADPRFFTRAGPFKISDIALQIGAHVPNGADADRLISDIEDIATASEGTLCFVTDKKYLPQLAETSAAAVLVGKAHVDACPPHVTALVCDDPYTAMARAAQAFYPEAALARPMPGQMQASAPAIHPSARIGQNCEIADSVTIGANAEIGDNTHLAANVVIGEGVALGRDCTLGAGVVVGYSLIGDRVTIHSGCRIGQCGFGFAPGKAHVKVPQLGRVIIQADVEMGANCAIDRGTLGDTIVGEGSKLDNLVHLAHNVVLGRHVFMAGQSGIAGGTHIGDYCQVGGQAGIYGHLTLGAHVVVGAKSSVTRSFPDNTQLMGIPARPAREFLRETAILKRLGKSGGKLTSSE